MIRASRMQVAFAVGLVVLLGCSKPQPVYDGQIASHSVDDLGGDSPKAIFANRVPVYPNAKFTETSGGESWGDESDSYSQRMTWWFQYSRPMDEVVAFYDAALPTAERSLTEDGDVMWTLHPETGQRYDEIEVIVGKGELRITEDVQGGRARKS